MEWSKIISSLLGTVGTLAPTFNFDKAINTNYYYFYNPIACLASTNSPNLTNCSPVFLPTSSESWYWKENTRLGWGRHLMMNSKHPRQLQSSRTVGCVDSLASWLDSWQSLASHSACLASTFMQTPQSAWNCTHALHPCPLTIQFLQKKNTIENDMKDTMLG
jgi:hypothetical protein